MATRLLPLSLFRHIASTLDMNLTDHLLDALAMDAEHELRSLITTSLTFLSHSKKTILEPTHIQSALKVRNEKPVFGFNHNGNVKYTAVKENNTFVMEDEIVDFNTIMNEKFPMVPLEPTYSAHWLAIDGVQPAVPQNPTTKQDASAQKKMSNQVGISVESAIAEAEGRPLVRHIISQELQVYYEKLTQALMHESQDLKLIAWQSLAQDPGLHQLVPYMVQFVQEQVQRNLRNLHIIDSMLHVVGALLKNETVFIEPYLHQLMPPLITCLVVKGMGQGENEDHWALRDAAATHLAEICNTYAHSYTSLAPRVTRTLMRALTDPDKDLTTQYGALIALPKLGIEVMHSLLIPYLPKYFERLRTLRTSFEDQQHEASNQMEIDHDRPQAQAGINPIALNKCTTAMKSAAAAYLRHELQAMSARGKEDDLQILIDQIDFGRDITMIIGMANTYQIADELMIDR